MASPVSTRSKTTGGVPPGTLAANVPFRNRQPGCQIVVSAGRLELPRVSPPDPKSGASACTASRPLPGPGRHRRSYLAPLRERDPARFRLDDAPGPDGSADHLVADRQ